MLHRSYKSILIFSFFSLNDFDSNERYFLSVSLLKKEKNKLIRKFLFSYLFKILFCLCDKIAISTPHLQRQFFGAG